MLDAATGCYAKSRAILIRDSNPQAVLITPNDFQTGGLRLSSYALPGKLFTANQRLITGQAGILNPAAFHRVVDAVVALLKSGLGP
jgi:mRNA interferase MazF